MKNPVIGMLIAANVLLVLALTAMWVDPQGQVRHTRWVRPDPIQSDYMQMLPGLPSREPVRTDVFLALLERPIFSSTRRPPPPPPPPVPAPPPDLLANAQIVGVFSGGSDSGGAIVRIDGKGRRIRLGESINGWRLTSVKERSAVFTNGGQTREMLLVRSKVSSAGADMPPSGGNRALVNIDPQAQVPEATPAATSTEQPAAEPASASAPASAAVRRRPRFGP
jgi:hypothetical protein